MIHKFSVSNYGSIREETTLDLRIPGTAPDLPRFRPSAARPDIRLPTVAVLMGPNGSGKTTLLRALVETSRFVVSSPFDDSSPPGIVGFTCFASDGMRGEPTRVCVEFEAGWLKPDEAVEVFRYELVLARDEGKSIDAQKVLREALFHFPKGRPRRLLDRGGPGEPIYASKEFGLKPSDERLKAVRANASVISTLAILNVPLAGSIRESIQLLVSTSNIAFHERWAFSTEDVVGMLERDPELQDRMNRELPRSDLGIGRMGIRTLSDGEKVPIFAHHGLDGPIPLPFESGGTKRFFHLLPQIHLALQMGSPICLDVIDGDLHVDLVGEVLRWFRSSEDNPDDAQLLVTSHNVGLLDDLEKEEIFIVEKDESGATRVHGAQDVRGLRRDARLYPKYRSGVLGGVPSFG